MNTDDQKIEGKMINVRLEKSKDGYYFVPISGGYGIHKSHNEMAYFQSRKAALNFIKKISNIKLDQAEKIEEIED